LETCKELKLKLNRIKINSRSTLFNSDFILIFLDFVILILISIN